MVEDFLNERGQKEIHARILYRWLFRRSKDGSIRVHPQDLQPDALPTDLSKELRAELSSKFTLTTSKVVNRTDSESGGIKLLVQLQDGHLVETVIIRHEHLSSKNVRHTVCVSSQVGCAKGCTFCATGTMGFRADLSAGEIAEQVYHAQQALEHCGREEEASIRNVVFMGMGEPLANYDEVLLALRYLTHQNLFNIAARHITVSTVGDSPAEVRRLGADAPRVRLAVSLHSALQETRHALMPATVGQHKSLADLGDAMDWHRARSG